MAAALLRAEFVRLAYAGSVSSAGTDATNASVAPETLAVMDEYGIDLRDHCAQRVDATLIQSADLILTMEANHIAKIVTSVTSAFAKTYAIREFVDRARERTPRTRDETILAYTSRLHVGRTPADVLRTVVPIEDPWGMQRAAHAKCATELAELARLAALLILPESWLENRTEGRM